MLNGMFSGGKYKYRKFDYSPMYYDERKEKLNKKIKQAELKGQDSPEAMEVRKEMLRSQMSSSWDSNKSKGSFLQTNFRSIIIIAALGLAAYWILFKWDIAGFLEKYI
jgi:hypothetical protein